MDRFILEPERKRVTGITSVTWWRGEKRGEYPKRRKISLNRVGWLESEILAWMQSRPISDIDAPGEGQ